MRPLRRFIRDAPMVHIALDLRCCETSSLAYWLIQLEDTKSGEELCWNKWCRLKNMVTGEYLCARYRQRRARARARSDRGDHHRAHDTKRMAESKGTAVAPPHKQQRLVCICSSGSIY